MMKATDVTFDPVFRNFTIYGLNRTLSYSPKNSQSEMNLQASIYL